MARNSNRIKEVHTKSFRETMSNLKEINLIIRKTTLKNWNSKDKVNIKQTQINYAGIPLNISKSRF